MASPKGTRFSPKVSKSFSPVKKSTTPPLFGKVAAISAKAFPAVAALDTASASRPLILLGEPHHTFAKANELLTEHAHIVVSGKEPCYAATIGQSGSHLGQCFPSNSCGADQIPVQTRNGVGKFHHGLAEWSKLLSKSPQGRSAGKPGSQTFQKIHSGNNLRIAPAKALTPSRSEEQSRGRHLQRAVHWP